LLFTQFNFWAFFAVVLVGYSLVYKLKTLRSLYLFLLSIFFYYKTSGFYFFLLIFSTLVDFFIGKSIYSSKTEFRKRILVVLSVITNLGVLSYYKYSYFFAETLNNMFGTDFQVVDVFAKWTNQFAGTHFDIDSIFLPVGISFFTFQTISYSVDIYRRKIKPLDNIIDFGFYVSFFPQLVAGPIVRASEFMAQIHAPYKLSRYEFGLAIYWILKGLAKKMFISDYIAVNFIDRVFSNPMTYGGFENLMALYGYSIQVYADFSGYTDVAIGVALLMGFRLPINFNSPYKALHVGEFWKRWHISLSTWLKDYLYIPLGGNRGGAWATYLTLSAILMFIVLLSGWLWLMAVFALVAAVFVLLAYLFPAVKRSIDTNINLMITMLLGGLWHGASWQFVIWGGLNGFGLVVYKFWRKISPFRGKHSWWVRFYAIFITFNFITFTRIWFRADSMEVANSIIYQISNAFDFSLLPAIIWSYKTVFAAMLFAYVVHWLPTTLKTAYRNWFIDTPHYWKVIISVIVVFIIYQVRSADIQPFIYFQF